MSVTLPAVGVLALMLAVCALIQSMSGQVFDRAVNHLSVAQSHALSERVSSVPRAIAAITASAEKAAHAGGAWVRVSAATCLLFAATIIGAAAYFDVPALGWGATVVTLLAAALTLWVRGRAVKALRDA